MHSLREFIRLLEERGEIAHVTRQVSGDEVAALVWELNDRKGPALWCDNVEGSRVPLAANLFGSFARVALALGLPPEAGPREIRSHYAELMEDKSKWFAPEVAAR
jgi:4-hydroxy-3-polyprenylbenzoate decarboxylase